MSKRPDWNEYVRRNLALPELTREREEQIREDLARQFEQAHADALARGATGQEAEAAARAHVPDWESFVSDVYRSERRNVKPRLDRWSDQTKVHTNTGGGMNSVNRWLSDFRQDVVYGLRALRKSPGFTTVAVLTLALGIGANTAIFSVVEGVLWRPLPYRDSDRLVFLWNHWTASDTKTVMAPGDLADYRDQTTLFEEFAAASAFSRPLTNLGDPELIPTGSVTSNFFPFLGYSPFMGRDFVPEDEANKAIVSFGFWQDRLGGAPSVIGSEIILSGGSRTIIGVLPQNFKMVLPQSAGIPREVWVWSPIPRGWLGSDGRDRTAHWMRTIGRLKAGVTIAQAQAEMDVLANRIRSSVPARAKRKAEIIVAPLHDEVVKPVRKAILLLWGGVGFVLLIAAANVANLQIARSRQRLQEMAIRMSLGAGRARILRQLSTETLLLALGGQLLGVLFAWGGIRVLPVIQPEEFPRFDNVEFNGMVFAFSLFLSLIALLLAGVVPAHKLANTDINRLMAAGGRTYTTRTGFWSRHLLTTGEVAVSLILLVGAGLMVRTMAHLIAIEPGFQTEGILTFQAARPRSVPLPTFHQNLEEAIRMLPGVQSVGSIFHTPLDGKGESSEYTQDEGLGDEFNRRAASRLVTGDLFETLRIPVIEGRAFSENDGGDVVIVDEKLARRVWGGESPIGKRLKISWWSGPVWARVVGMVPTLHSEYLYQEDRETLYRVAYPFAYDHQTFVVRTEGDLGDLAQAIRRELRQAYPDVPLTKVRPLESYRAAQMAPSRFILTLLGIFAAIGLVLAVGGLYGVISYGVSRRTQEFGIRMALGAQTHDVLRLVLRDGLALILMGLVIGVAGALGLSRIVSSLLHGVAPEDWLAIGSVTTLLFVVALLACYFPARRASKVDPIVALRYE